MELQHVSDPLLVLSIAAWHHENGSSVCHSPGLLSPNEPDDTGAPEETVVIDAETLPRLWGLERLLQLLARAGQRREQIQIEVV